MRMLPASSWYDMDVVGSLEEYAASIFRISSDMWRRLMWWMVTSVSTKPAASIFMVGHGGSRFTSGTCCHPSSGRIPPRRPWFNPSVDEKVIIIKWSFVKWAWMADVDWIHRIRKVDGFYESGNERLGAIRDREFLEYLSDHQLLKNNSPPESRGHGASRK